MLTCVRNWCVQLRESLGGNTKSNLIVCCSPHAFNLDETVSTLRFAQRKTPARPKR